MPGVTYGGKWSSRNSRESDFGSYSSRNMSPQRKHDTKGSSVSQYSNGYNSDRNSEVRDDYPTYLLEHLATFSVGTQYGIQNPKDGLRRLLQMEKSSGIWTQKMQMRLEKKWIIIIDNENGDIVERFPMNLIADPTSYTSNDPRELYNNVIVFIVKDDPKNKNHNPPEMHIFQCARVSAQEVVNEMKMFINGKWKPGHRERYIPPPPTNPPPEPPVNGVNVKEQVNLFNAVAAAAASPPREDGLDISSHSDRMIQRVSSSGYHKIDRMDNGSDRNASYSRDSNDETSSTSSEKYERDVAILNHCFDDIERFIARLQHAAAAFKELERRQKSRKNKKKDMGDGMLSMRAKPPSEREFVDVLQKFKLSFNLLAKLKNHIHDPNAPELVHFLFTPLALIVDAAKDSNYSTELASRVSAPLLTRDACELLMNCCTSKESDLLHSLGEAWIVPRDQWKSFEGTYHPVFSDGWAPENPFSEKRERAEATAVAAAAMAQKYHRDDVRRSQEESEMRHAEYRVPSRQDRESRYGSEFHYSERGERPLSPLHAHEPPHPSFENRFYDQNLETPGRDVFERNGAVTPVSDHDFADHRDRDMRSDFSADSIDHVNPLDPNRQFETQQKQWLEDMKSRGARIVQVMYPRTANNDKELTVVRGELLEVIDDSRKWWKARNARGQVAHVPHTIVGPVSSVDEDSFNNPIYGSRGNGNGTKEPYYTPSDSPVGRERLAENGHRDPPSGMPKGHVPLPAPAPADWIRRERQGKKDKHAYEEIEATLTIDDMCESPTDKQLRHKRPLKAETSFTEKSKTLPRSVSVMDTLHDELKMRFTLGPKSGKKCNIIDRQSLPITHLTPMSSAYDVQLWLNAKGFSARAQQKLQNVKGESMFLLSKSEIEEDLGPEEGSKLYNQLMIQKNICGYNMRSSKELSAILEARRKRIDSDDSSEDTTGGKYYEGNTAKPEIKKTEMKKAEIPKKERKQTEGKTNEMKRAEIPKSERKQTELKNNEIKKAEIPKKERKQEEERNNEMKMAEIPKIERKQSELKNNEMRKAEIQKIERKQTEVKNNEMKAAEMPKMDRKQTDVKKIEENKTPVGVWF